jgi:hypothetical protein
MRLLIPAVAIALSCTPALAGCATYQDDLARGQRAFEGSEDERALAIFRVLEPDTPRLSETDRAHYAYLRGMTDYRMGYKSEARHWLSMASAMAKQTPDVLPEDWAKRMNNALKELNEAVYAAGTEALTNTPSQKSKGDDDQGSSDSTSSGDSDKPAKKQPKSDDSN